MHHPPKTEQNYLSTGSRQRPPPPHEQTASCAPRQPSRLLIAVRIYMCVNALPETATTEEDPMREIDIDTAAEIDRIELMNGGQNKQDMRHFVYRDARTGRVAPAHKAGTPGTVRAEMREKQVGCLV